jgi:hypothetical protein
VKDFAYARVDWRRNDYALRPGYRVDHLLWPHFIVQAPNPTFYPDWYQWRATVVFWAPTIFWPW